MDPLEKTSHAYRAAALSILPGLGHLYIGEKRGGPLLLAGILLIFLWAYVLPLVRAHDKKFPSPDSVLLVPDTIAG